MNVYSYAWKPEKEEEKDGNQCTMVIFNHLLTGSEHEGVQHADEGKKSV
jgi:hypothetical protein